MTYKKWGVFQRPFGGFVANKDHRYGGEVSGGGTFGSGASVTLTATANTNIIFSPDMISYHTPNSSSVSTSLITRLVTLPAFFSRLFIFSSTDFLSRCAKSMSLSRKNNVGSLSKRAPMP